MDIFGLLYAYSLFGFLDPSVVVCFCGTSWYVFVERLWTSFLLLVTGRFHPVVGLYIPVHSSWFGLYVVEVLIGS